MSAIRALAHDIIPFSSEDNINRVMERFRDDSALNDALSVPVVDADGLVLGSISRYQLNSIFLKNFGRELYGSRAVTQFMNQDCLRVEISLSLADAAQYVIAHMQTPLSEDFVVCEQGRYVGVGGVLTLLAAMEQQVEQGARELAQAYQKLQSSQAQLVQSEKMASLGQMVAGVAHEINTPLGYVKNNVELMREFSSQLKELLTASNALVDALLDPEGSDVEVARQLAAIEDLRSLVDPDMLYGDMETLFGDTGFGLSQISELVLGLKDFSRLDQAHTDNVSLNDCVNNALLIAKNALKTRIEVIRLLGDIPRIACAPSQLNQVLLNLVTNAAQAMEGPGKIAIKTWADETSVYVSVQDTGKGMAPETVKKIFDPFFTTKPVGEGTGLGLSISWQIIQQHGGSIKVASELGRGTRFVIVLPRERQATASSRKEAAAAH
ncbi:MAG: sensor histidine kinase [Moraxellaceae bacterium]